MFKHFYVLCIVTALWAWFLLGGLWSNYYKDWSFYTQLIVIDIIPCIIMTMFAPGFIKLLNKNKALQSSFFVAFYFSVPLIIYDYIYLGVYKGYGLSFLREFWFLSGFSILPWTIFPYFGYKMQYEKVKANKAISADAKSHTTD